MERVWANNTIRVYVTVHHMVLAVLYIACVRACVRACLRANSCEILFFLFNPIFY